MDKSITGLSRRANVRLRSRSMTEQPSSPPPIPKFDMHSLILFFWENMAVIRRYWILFAAVALICVVTVGTIVRTFDARQIEILAATNAQLRDQKISLQQTAASTPPSQWRRLSDQERIDLIQGLRQWRLKPKRIVVFAMAESESRQYAAQFVDVLRSVGIAPQPRELSLSIGPTDTGLMVGVIKFDDPPPEAREFLDLLNKAGISAHFTPWDGAPNEDPSFDLFVGPKPW